MSYRFVDSFRAGPDWNSTEFHPEISASRWFYYKVIQPRLKLTQEATMFFAVMYRHFLRTR